MIVKVSKYKKRNAKGKITHYSDKMKIYSWIAPEKEVIENGN